MTPVIDFHVHAGLYHELHPWVTEWIKTQIEDPETFVKDVLTPEGIVRYLRHNGVDYAVALAELSPITTGVLSNEEVAELCQEVDCLIPFCNVNPFLVADLAGELTGRTYPTCATPATSWNWVTTRASPDDLICVTGSFFIVAEIRPQIPSSLLSASGGDTSAGHIE